MKIINFFDAKHHALLTDIALLMLRMMFGFGMLYGHGLGKLQRLTSGEEVRFMEFLGMSPEVTLALVVFAEVVCAILIIAGAFTRLATIPLIIAMFVAIFVRHIDDPFSKMEKAWLYFVPYLTLLLTGAGRFSIDNWLLKRKK